MESLYLYVPMAPNGCERSAVYQIKRYLSIYGHLTNKRLLLIGKPSEILVISVFNYSFAIRNVYYKALFKLKLIDQLSAIVAGAVNSKSILLRRTTGRMSDVWAIHHRVVLFRHHFVSQH